jgi:MFS family permease
LRQVLSSMTFWIVAIAHAGDATIGTSQRVLGRYYFDSSGGTLPESKASGLAIVLPFGAILGLAIGGNMFKGSSPRGQQRLIIRLYALSICACYLLAAFSIPMVKQLIGDPGLILSFQLTSTFFMGFGGAVQPMIPGIIGGSFGKNKGLFSAYTDGIAYGLSSLVWRVVGGAVHGGDSGGWAYGWAAVALIVIICAFMMVEFFENFFVHGKINVPATHTGSCDEAVNLCR